MFLFYLCGGGGEGFLGILVFLVCLVFLESLEGLEPIERLVNPVGSVYCSLYLLSSSSRYCMRFFNSSISWACASIVSFWGVSASQSGSRHAFFYSAFFNEGLLQLFKVGGHHLVHLSAEGKSQIGQFLVRCFVVH